MCKYIKVNSNNPENEIADRHTPRNERFNVTDFINTYRKNIQLDFELFILNKSD